MKETTTSLSEITNLVCKIYGVTWTDLRSRSRKAEIVTPRQMCMYLARKYTTESYESIGKFFNRNHATVMAAQRKWMTWAEKPSVYFDKEDALNLNNAEFLIENKLTNEWFVMFSFMGQARGNIKTESGNLIYG